MGIMSFPVVGPGSITDTWDPTTNPRGELGQILFMKNSAGEVSIVEIVQLDNSGCSQGEALVQNHATLKGYSVRQSATTDEGVPMKGVAAATIASQKAGYMIIGGYCEKMDLSHTAASGEYICIGGSTAAKFTVNKASCFNQGTLGNASQVIPVAVARAAFATGVGSVQILGVWG
jgi:hypothetical protein